MRHVVLAVFLAVCSASPATAQAVGVAFGDQGVALTGELALGDGAVVAVPRAGVRFDAGETALAVGGVAARWWDGDALTLDLGVDGEGRTGGGADARLRLGAGWSVRRSAVVVVEVSRSLRRAEAARFLAGMRLGWRR